MSNHLQNIGSILTYILEKTSANTIIDRFGDDIEAMVENHITVRDIDNFVAYFKFLFSTAKIPKKLVFEKKLLEAFVNRTYAKCSDDMRKIRSKKLFDYLKQKVDPKTVLTASHLDELEKHVRELNQPSLDILKEQCRSALILKWLQGEVQEQISRTLQDYITFLATVYGQFKSGRVFVVDWHSCDVSVEDRDVLTEEYRIFECSVMEAHQVIKKAIAREPRTSSYKEQFRIVLVSLDNLVRMTKKGELNSPVAFRDKIIVATTLIYVQDDFVKKDAELKKLINLFVSLYFQFRDKHYAAPEQKE